MTSNSSVAIIGPSSAGQARASARTRDGRKVTVGVRDTALQQTLPMAENEMAVETTSSRCIRKYPMQFAVGVSVGKFLRKMIQAAFLAVTGIVSAHAASPVAVEAQHGIVVTSQRLASEVGAEIFRAGGNAVDAAVAAAYAEAVVNPCCGNFGGGGFMVLHLAGSDHFINFRETAPAAATANMYLDGQGNIVKGASLFGYKAAGVPGTVMGRDTALHEYGKLPRAQVMEPAIRLARDGFVLARGDTDILDFATERFRKDPKLARVFLRPDGSRLQPGDRLVQTDMANTLEDIAKDGSDIFYKGRIAKEVEAASRAGGGLLTIADFAAYKVTESSPLGCTYRGATILSAPPPSSGGVTMCEILNVLEGYDMRASGFHSAEGVHLIGRGDAPSL
jgi:gamma-glutamyltranspeptidase/glutathione hydrolase